MVKFLGINNLEALDEKFGLKYLLLDDTKYNPFCTVSSPFFPLRY